MKRGKSVIEGKFGIMNCGVQKSGMKKTVMMSIITADIIFSGFY